MNLRGIGDYYRSLAAQADAAVPSHDYTTLFPSPARSGVTQKKGGLSGDARQGFASMNVITDHGQKTTLIKRSPIIIPTKPAIEYAGVVEMSPSEWQGVADNPRQRDTEKHARSADHLRVLHPSHCKVNMARLANGQLYKLDGHTRAFLWASGQLAPPTTLYVDLWECRSLEDAKSLYGTFDSKGAVETTADQMFGAKRDQNVTFSSPLLKGGRFASGMRFAYECLFGVDAADRTTVYDLLKFWERELSALDDCNPSTSRFHTGVVSAALLTLRRYGSSSSEFWTLFARGAGVKLNGTQDAVHAFEDRMERRRFEKKLIGRGNIYDIIGIALSAHDRFRRGESYASEGHGETGKGKSGGIKGLKENSFREWMIAAKNSTRAL